VRCALALNSQVAPLTCQLPARRRRRSRRQRGVTGTAPPPPSIRAAVRHGCAGGQHLDTDARGVVCRADLDIGHPVAAGCRGRARLPARRTAARLLRSLGVPALQLLRSSRVAVRRGLRRRQRPRPPQRPRGGACVGGRARGSLQQQGGIRRRRPCMRAGFFRKVLAALTTKACCSLPAMRYWL